MKKFSLINDKSEADYLVYFCDDDIQEVKETLILNNQRVISPYEADFKVCITDNKDEATISIMYHKFPEIP
ncbi:MAG: hypothetical protein GX219_09190 [Tissierellia bacterium]|nr:hypothetical protein [Tissierellia bacterium]